MRICPEGLERHEGDAATCPVHGVPLLPLGEGDPLCGTLLANRFLVLDRLGRGGMGSVYRALQVAVRRRVALKLLYRTDRGPDHAARFVREARAMAELRCPFTVTVFDFGELPNGDRYLAMELVDGPSLGSVIRTEGALLPARAVRLLRQVCLSLEEAHARGILHRDLKPANIMVEQRPDGDEWARVLDFGLAKFLAETSSGPTVDGGVLGTPAYMAPEQARGERAGPETDIYALGVTAFEMLSGRPPFAGETLVGVLMAHITTPAPLLGEAVPQRTPALDALEPIVARCLRKHSAERYPSVRALREALEEVPTDGDAAAGPAPPPRDGPGMSRDDRGTAPDAATPSGPLAPFAGTTSGPLAPAPPAGSAAVGSSSRRTAVLAVVVVTVAAIVGALAAVSGRPDGPPPPAPLAREATPHPSPTTGSGRAALPSPPDDSSASGAAVRSLEPPDAAPPVPVGPTPVEALGARDAAASADEGAPGPAARADDAARPDEPGRDDPPAAPPVAPVRGVVPPERPPEGAAADRDGTPAGAGRKLDPTPPPSGAEPQRRPEARLGGLETLGVPPDGARTTLRDIRSRLSACRRAATGGAAGAPGLRVSLLLEPSGAVKTVMVQPADATGRQFADCARASLQRLQFPSFSGRAFGTVRFTVGP
jgi:serine/threonine-protein kinase